MKTAQYINLTKLFRELGLTEKNSAVQRQRACLKEKYEDQPISNDTESAFCIENIHSFLWEYLGDKTHEEVEIALKDSIFVEITENYQRSVREITELSFKVQEQNKRVEALENVISEIRTSPVFFLEGKGISAKAYQLMRELDNELRNGVIFSDNLKAYFIKEAKRESTTV
jgi:hypothetical protein